MRVSAILWLVPGLLCGLVTLAGCGGGGYWVYETHSDVEKFQDEVTKETDLLEKRKKGFKNVGDDFKQGVHKAEVELQNAERSRLIAAIVTATSLIPALMTLAFLGMAGVKFMQKDKKPMVEVEIEEDGEPPANQSRARSEAE